MELCRISLLADPAILGPNRKRKLRETMQLKRKAWMDARYAWMNAGRPTAKNKVIVHILVRRATEMDDDNIIAGLKHHRDGLFVNAITPDDRPRYVKLGGVEQEIHPKYKLKPEVIFIVEEIE